MLHSTVLQDLGCAWGKAQDTVGCTACPVGAKRSKQPVRPQMMAGSVFMQLQPEGVACYSFAP